ncbi:MAG: hypothetical protein Q9169_004382 [Polycauliona sp. 2 TL-2023]
MEVANPTPSTTDNQPLFKKRTTKKTNVRKRPATPPPADSDSSGYSSTSGDEAGVRIKRRRKIAAITASSSHISKPTTTDLSATKFAGDRSSQIESTDDATKQSNWFDEENETTTRNLLGTTRARPTATTSQAPGSVTEPNDTYKGQRSYQSFIQRNPNAPTRTVGPVKAPTNIRTITVTDFAPDVCKDYKQTGFCGFGDSCKFLHAREDYKQGWELDKDWEIGTKGKKAGALGGKNITAMNKGKGKGNGMDEDEDEDAVLEGIPFACIICKKRYTNPIVTKCGHYFCEKCALMRYRKSPACAACGAGTGGVFNGAKGLKKLLDKKRDRARKRREQAIAEGKEVDEDDEEVDEDGDGS